MMMDISETLVTSELETLDAQVSRVMRETPSYQLSDGEVVYLREEYWIKPLVNVWECEFSKDMFGLIWKPVEVPGWTEINGVYILDEYIEETVDEYIDVTPITSGIPDSYQEFCSRAALRLIRNSQLSRIPVDVIADDFPEAVCPICGKTTCDHYDDHEPLFKSCQTIGG